MAPEQAAGDPNVDLRADLYAWSVVAYECLTGTHPFVSSHSPQRARHAGRARFPWRQHSPLWLPDVSRDVPSTRARSCRSDRRRALADVRVSTTRQQTLSADSTLCVARLRYDDWVVVDSWRRREEVARRGGILTLIGTRDYLRTVADTSDVISLCCASKESCDALDSGPVAVAKSSAS